MKKSFKFLTLGLYLLSTLALVSCEKKEDGPKAETKPVGTVNAQIKISDGAEKSEFVYFSFMKTKQVAIAPEKVKTDTDWDLAFLDINGRTNGGQSGAGKAAVYRTEYDDFEGIKSAEPFIADKSEWVLDKVQETTSYGKMPPKQVKDSFNKHLIKGWYEFDMSGGMPPKFIITKDVYIIRTAKGDYVKLQFLAVEYENKKLSAIKFRYAYISETGKNNVTPKKRDGEVILSEVKTGMIEEALKNEKVENIKILTIKKSTLNQADINAIKKLPKLEELDLRKATLSIDTYDKGFKDSKVIKKLIAPQNLEATGLGWFGYMSQLEEIVFPGTALKSIGNGTFSMSRKLSKIELPESLEIIEPDAFYATAIAKIKVPEKVKHIPSGCFFYCKQLKEVYLPKSIISLGDAAFGSCTELEKIVFASSTPPAFAINPETKKPVFPFNGLTWKKGEKRFFCFYVPKGSVSAYLNKWGWKEKDAAYFEEYELKK
ncbi:Uncharacterised protein [Porphyromonas macacae]|uniref:Uncharacterized protein n=1 Tax=Porphyromonas macacae TaxID=28115 RepID=A0A379E8U7_9PORP|nr:leucine-rich repeat protein [Porphyromonas macacae]SUB88771.1 Uncharacterised protein [Porphyromonas macacae]